MLGIGQFPHDPAFNGLDDDAVGPRGVDADPGAVGLHHLEGKSMFSPWIGGL